jgi:hypothetical protein
LKLLRTQFKTSGFFQFTSSVDFPNTLKHGRQEGERKAFVSSPLAGKKIVGFWTLMFFFAKLYLPPPHNIFHSTGNKFCMRQLIKTQLEIELSNQTYLKLYQFSCRKWNVLDFVVTMTCTFLSRVRPAIFFTC